jgi:hypothetical protein
MSTIRQSCLRCFGACLLFAVLRTFAQTLPVTDGLELWLRADAGVTTNSAGGITAWADQSVNGNNASQSDDAQAPLLVNGALNNRPVLRFDGVDDFLDVADSDSLSFTGDMASFFVVKFDDFEFFRAVWGKTAANLPAPTDMYAVPGSGVLRVYRGDGTTNNLTPVDSNPLRVNTYLVLGFDVAGETLTHYLNNEENGAGTVTTNTADANTSLKIGTRNDLVTRLKGDLAELLIYSRALSSNERSNVFNYLQTKYDLLNLPPTCSLASTPAGPNVSVGTLVTLNATPNDPDGTIAKVDFFANGTLVATATAPPYSLPVTLDSAGTTVFTARATDNKAGTGNSAPISLTAGPAGPTSLTVTGNLQLWLRADVGTTTGASGGVVAWADQSPNLNDALQLEENLAPTLTNNAVNGLPALRFDGADDFLEIADSASLSITGDITSFYVTRFADFATFRAVWAKTLGNLPAPTDIYALPDSGVARIYRGNGTLSGIQFVDSARAYPAGSYILAGFDQAGTTFTHYLGGLVNGSGSITVPLTDADGTLRIGTRADLVTRFKGEMAELLIYDRALSAAERRSVERYLAEKYGLPALVSTANAAPSVAITDPSGQVLPAPGMVTVTAAANDGDGSIVGVQFFADGVSLGTDATAPYTATLNLSYGGGLTLTAVATDNLGAQASAAPVRVCIQGPGAPAGLVGYWPLDGNAMAVVGVNGSLVNGPIAADDRNGVAGGALSFDGSQFQRVEVPGGGGLNGAQQGTISLWVKWSGLQDGGFGGTFGAVLGRQANARFSDDIINLNSASPEAAMVQWRQVDPTSATITSSGAVLNDVWRHIAVTFTTSSSQLFVDGFSEGTGGGGALRSDASIPLMIGAWGGDGDSYATAAIDDVAVWNRVLSADEIQALTSQSHTPLTLAISPDCLTIERSGSNAVIKWGSATVLQSAFELPSPAGIPNPWDDVVGATSPYTVGLTNAARYFRLRSP